ncbi:hypothetical protein [Xenorhabdus hominickii]|uniref:Uncharacterized protein n=1 Tax=Xenorhabdus hominickii TaxID=351679 RepID=A0A2G0QE17_XENHO|nr:hypothetical protein [Xenorhabdus hominickii]AOM41515.1 hypothetical protein A9255_13610 [Xenorhabdus hominickii]PHM57458.1 hypothetical protein Xhom_00425 [Xenorhabdus hominickii]
MADFYLKIKTNRMILKNLKNQKELKIEGSFSTSRLLIGEFDNAVFQLHTLINQHGFLKGIKRLFERKHRVLIHPLEQSEDGLCSVEERILQEVTHVGFNGHIRKVVIHQGEHLLSDNETKAELSKRIPKNLPKRN